MTTSKNEMIDHIILSLGGRAAEEIVLDDISTGASNDIQKATAIARNMVTRYGMSEKLGTILYDSEHSADEVFLGRDFSSGKNYSEKTAAEIDDEIRFIINGAYNTCKKYLTENINKLHFIAEFLLKNESMDEEQFLAAMESENPSIEEIESIAIEKKNKSAEENKTAHENNAKAEEEARAKEEEESKNKAESNSSNGEFSSEDFFNKVWEKPDEEKESDSDFAENESTPDEDDGESVADTNSDSDEENKNDSEN
jgi:cell division protease FtsH